MSIEHVMKRIGRILAADENLEVEVRGDSAYAMPGRVVLPGLETFDGLPYDLREVLLNALADHECGHAADSDFEVIERVAKENIALKVLLNAIEDGYIEGRRGHLYVGSRYLLGKKNEWFWANRFAGLRTGEDRIRSPENLWEGFILATTLVVRPDGGKTIEQIEDLNPVLGAMLREVEPELRKVETLVTESKQTLCSERIARAIWDKLRLDETAKEPENDDGQGQGESGDCAGEPGDCAGEPGDGESDDTSANDEGQMPSPEHLEMELRRFSEHGEPLNPEQALQTVIRKVFDQPSHVRPYIVFDHDFDIERELDVDTADDSKVYDLFKDEASAATNALVIAFEYALRAKREKRPVRGEDDTGLVDLGMLPEFAVGAAQIDDLWMDYAAEDDENVAVAVLTDNSGSMGNGPGSSSHLARMCSIAFHEALTRVQVPHELTGFTTISSEHTGHPWWRPEYHDHFKRLRKVVCEAESHGTDLSKFARTGHHSGSALLLPIYGIFKRFGQVDGRGLVNISGISQNLDGEAVLWQARRLARRPERRRVMFVFSDGYPAGSRDNAQGAQYLKQAVERVIAAGIEVYGLGIMSDAVKQFYPTWWICNDLSSLCDIAMGALTETVARTRMERRWITGL